MKAYFLKGNGGIGNLVMTDVPRPMIKSNEVLVEVKAIAINPIDVYVRSNEAGMKTYLKPGADELWRIPGWDIAGIVKDVGSDVTKFTVGDEVFGLVNYPGHGKGYAEYVAARADHLGMKPANIPFEEAAGATLAALTAWQGLSTHAHVKAHEKVVIHAAAGGVGHYAVQIAKALGAHVVAATSTSNEAFVRTLEATEIAIYGSQNFEEIVSGADVVFESLGGDHTITAAAALKHGGRLVSLLSPIEGKLKDVVLARDVRATRMMVESNGHDMERISSLMKERKLKTHVSHRFTFDELRKAHQQIETRGTNGKVIVAL